jgi:hypothetical protein
MGQFTLNWDNSAVLASANSTGQRASYRQKSVGGAFNTGGFAPANDLLTSASTVLSPVVLNNVVYEFIIENLCSSGGPTLIDNGIQEQIAFSCIGLNVVKDHESSTATIDLTNTDITKVRFILRKSSDNTIVYGPNDIVRISGANSISVTATGLTASTTYYWQVILFAVVNGVEVNSSMPAYINDVCGPTLVTTDASPAALLVWVEDTTSCETEGGFGVLKTITGLSSPAATWYDSVNGLVYVADWDDFTDGNVYWFNPATANNAGDMTHSSAINDSLLYNTTIDTINRRIYFVGRDTGGLLVYDIDTDTTSTVAFGVNGINYSRTVLTMGANYIYCNYNNGAGVRQIIIIDRTTLTVTATINTSTLYNPTRFNGGFQIVEVGAEIWVCSFNALIGTIDVFSANFAGHLQEITLPSASVWTGGGSTYWTTIFYDITSGNVYVGDTGSNRRYIIDPSTYSIIDTQVNNNREGKTNVLQGWTTNPITNELIFQHTAQNTSADGAPIKRVYI